MSFDTLIIDEAAQCVEPSCWIPILKAKRLILAGDHLQLPPTVKSAKPGEGLDRAVTGRTNGSKKGVKAGAKPEAEPAEAREAAQADGDEGDDDEQDEVDGEDDEDSEGAPSATPTANTPPQPRRPRLRLRPTKSLTTTLFSRLLALHGDPVRRMLTTSYRFNAKICAFPSQRLYGGALVPAPAVADRRLTDLDGVDDEELAEQVVFIDTAGAGMYERAPEGKGGGYGAESKANENEAQLCVEYVAELVEGGVPRGSIALVSPYNAQVTLLASLLNQAYPDDPPEVGSIDSYQGQFHTPVPGLLRHADFRLDSCRARERGGDHQPGAVQPGRAGRLPGRAAPAERGHDAGEEAVGGGGGQRDGREGERVLEGLDGVAGGGGGG